MTDFSKIGRGAVVRRSPPRSTSAPRRSRSRAIVSMIIVMLVIMTETTADILAIGEVVGRPADGKTVANGLRADMPVHRGLRRPAQRLLGQRVRPERRAGRDHRHQEPVRRRRQRRDPGGARPVPEGRGDGRRASRCRCSAAPGWPCSAPWPPAASAALAAVNYEGNDNLVIVALSIGMGVIPIAVPDLLRRSSRAGSRPSSTPGISAAAVTAVLLNILFNVGRSGTHSGGGARRRVADGRRHAGLRRAGRRRRTRATPPTTAAVRRGGGPIGQPVDPGPSATGALTTPAVR